MSHGFIKLPREFMASRLWLAERFTRGQALLDLYGLANHAHSTIFIHGIQVDLRPGQLAWAQSSLSKRWRWNRRTTARFFRGLEVTREIHISVSRLTTITTMLHWKEWQESTQRSAQQSAQQTAQQSAHRQEGKEGREGKEHTEGAEEPFPKDASKNNSSGVLLFRAWWATEFNRRNGTPYVFAHGKDEKTIKDLLAACGGDIEKLRARALQFFASSDPFLEKAGHTLGVFQVRLNGLGEQHSKGKPPALTETQKYLQEQAK
jgi:hypothetical protein